MTARKALAQLRRLGNGRSAASAARYFKTGKGEYGEGDRFLGVAVPAIRELTRTYAGLSLDECRWLLQSAYNEARLLGLLVMVRQFARADDAGRKRICQRYLENRQRVNNWNLVDSSAPQILGASLLDAPRSLLDELASSDSLWDRRIAVVATQHFIRAGDYSTTLRLARRLLQDDQDLMHKACGWMLREVGDRSRPTLEAFLRRHYRKMPRTMLRYAIEKLPEARRAAYLKGTLRVAAAKRK